MKGKTGRQRERRRETATAADTRRAPTSRLLIRRALGVRCRVVLYSLALRGALRQRSSRLKVNSTLRAVAATVSAKRPVRRCAVCDEGGPRCSGLPPVPRGDEICSCGVSCLAPTPAPRGAEGLSEASALLSLWACSVCAHPYCPTLVSWRRRSSPAAPPASCSSRCLFYFLLEPRPETTDTPLPQTTRCYETMTRLSDRQ